MFHLLIEPVPWDTIYIHLVALFVDSCISTPPPRTLSCPCSWRPLLCGVARSCLRLSPVPSRREAVHRIKEPRCQFPTSFAPHRLHSEQQRGAIPGHLGGLECPLMSTRQQTARDCAPLARLCSAAESRGSTYVPNMTRWASRSLFVRRTIPEERRRRFRIVVSRLLHCALLSSLSVAVSVTETKQPHET